MMVGLKRYSVTVSSPRQRYGLFHHLLSGTASAKSRQHRD